MKMIDKFACVAAGVPGHSFAEKCVAIAQAGCDGVETIVFPDTRLEHWQADVRAAAGGAGITIATVILGGLALHRNGCDAYVAEAMQAIAEVGAGVLLTPEYASQDPLPLFPPHAAPPPAEHERVRDAMRAIGVQATRLGCTVYVEPITHFESRFCRCVDDALALCEAADSAHVSVVLDTHNMNITEASIVGSIRRARGRIGHMHLADNNRMLPGCGHIAFDAVLAALCDIEYDGWLSFECAAPGEFTAAVRKCTAWLRAGASEESRRWADETPGSTAS